MRQRNVVREKAFEFAIEVVRVCRMMVQEQREYVLSRQLLKSGTSIGANIEEAQGGQSRRDFIAKLSISHKEALETIYWLKLLKATQQLNSSTVDSLLSKAEALSKILSSILVSAKRGIYS
jgi:four helix bundle protein